MCTCRTAPGGGVIVCDHCASQMIEALNNLLPGDPNAQELPEVMTPGEYKGMIGAVNGWLNDLQSQEEAQ